MSGGPYIGKRLGIVGEMARRVVSDSELGAAAEVEEAAYMGGGVVRQRIGAVSAFGQLVFGWMFRRMAEEGGQVGVRWRGAGLVVQTGGGLDIGSRGNTSVRVAIMHLRVLDNGRERSSLRVAVGAAYRFGAAQ